MNRTHLAIMVTFILAGPGLVNGTPPDGGVEGPHGNIPGFPVNSCYVCHDNYKDARYLIGIVRHGRNGDFAWIPFFAELSDGLEPQLSND